MNRKERKGMIRALMPVVEEIAERKILPREKVLFWRGLIGLGDPIELKNDGCGKRTIQLFERKWRYIVRIGLSLEAVRIGCIEEAKGWMTKIESALKNFAGGLGQKYLPVEVVISTIDPGGKVISCEGKTSLDRGG